VKIAGLYSPWRRLSSLDLVAEHIDTLSISAKGNDDPATRTSALEDGSGVASCLGTCPWCDIFPLCLPDKVGSRRYDCARQEIDHWLDHPEAEVEHLFS